MYTSLAAETTRNGGQQPLDLGLRRHRQLAHRGAADVVLLQELALLGRLDDATVARREQAGLDGVDGLLPAAGQPVLLRILLRDCAERRRVHGGAHRRVQRAHHRVVECRLVLDGRLVERSVERVAGVLIDRRKRSTIVRDDRAGAAQLGTSGRVRIRIEIALGLLLQQIRQLAVQLLILFLEAGDLLLQRLDDLVLALDALVQHVCGTVGLLLRGRQLSIHLGLGRLLQVCNLRIAQSNCLVCRSQRGLELRSLLPEGAGLGVRGCSVTARLLGGLLAILDRRAKFLDAVVLLLQLLFHLLHLLCGRLALFLVLLVEADALERVGLCHALRQDIQPLLVIVLSRARLLQQAGLERLLRLGHLLRHLGRHLLADLDLHVCHGLPAVGKHLLEALDLGQQRLALLRVDERC
eukprot:m.88448 g.88448  ORF g.88448 m.88448 type:complete len:410 (+) comp8370_c0_seq2:82-1311(+)